MKPVPDFARFFDPATPVPGRLPRPPEIDLTLLARAETEGEHLTEAEGKLVQSHRDYSLQQRFGGYSLNLPEQVYRDAPAINSSILKEPTPCQMVFQMMKDRDDDFETQARAEAFTTGLLLHDAILEPWKFNEAEKDDHFIECETKGLTTVKAATQRAENPGLLVVTPELVDKARRCMDAIQANPEAMRLLTAPGLVGSREASGFVFDPEMQIWRKMRVDFVPANANYLVDVKTTRSDLWRFPKKDCNEFGYYKQSAWYLSTHEMLTGRRPDSFYWIVVTKDEPFMSRVFQQQNLEPDFPLYEDSSLCKARQLLGIEDSARIGHLPMFIDSARQTVEYRERGVPINDALLRKIWPAYEQEQPIFQIL